MGKTQVRYLCCAFLALLLFPSLFFLLFVFEGLVSEISVTHEVFISGPDGRGDGERDAILSEHPET